MIVDGAEETDEAAPLGSFAPPWLPDSSVSMCQLCSFNFTMTRRRHHCRACGMVRKKGSKMELLLIVYFFPSFSPKIFCADCSGYFSALKYKNYKIGRVCQTCFEKLEGKEKNSLNITRNFNCIHTCSGSDSSSPTKRVVKSLPRSHKHVSLPSVLREVRARDQSAQISDYLHCSTSKNRRWKKRWFVVYNLVLYEFERHEVGLLFVHIFL